MSKNDRNIDAVDERLISHLRRNARTPITLLAKEAGISRRNAQDRLRRLETRGAIAGYTVRLGWRTEASMQAFIALTLTPGHSCSDVAANLAARTQVLKCFSVAGTIDLLVLVEAKGTHELSAFREVVAQISGVQSVQTIPVLAEHVEGG